MKNSIHKYPRHGDCDRKESIQIVQLTMLTLTSPNTSQSCVKVLASELADLSIRNGPNIERCKVSLDGWFTLHGGRVEGGEKVDGRPNECVLKFRDCVYANVESFGFLSCVFLSIHSSLLRLLHRSIALINNIKNRRERNFAP